MKCMKQICDFIARWMGAMVLLVAALALAVPASFEWIDTWAINPMLGVIMFGMGLTLSPQDFKIVLSRPKDILIGCLTQFTVMPLLALGLTWAFALPSELAIGVILVGCCPGGTASNVITYLAKGDLALSVGMTAASTLLAPLLTPLLVWALAGTMVDVDTVGMLMSINISPGPLNLRSSLAMKNPSFDLSIIFSRSDSLLSELEFIRIQ